VVWLVRHDRIPHARRGPLMPKSTPAELRDLHDGVFDRARGLCEWPYCPDPAEEMAHLTHRGMGGSKLANNPANCAALCKRHHDVLDGRTALGTLRWELNELMRRTIRDAG
jgi:5-methylcytosine-specific restriction endonuclease McrA